MEKEAKNSVGSSFSHRKVYKNVVRGADGEEESKDCEDLKTAA